MTGAEVNDVPEWRSRSRADVEQLMGELGYERLVLDDPSPINWLMYPKERAAEIERARRDPT